MSKTKTTNDLLKEAEKLRAKMWKDLHYAEQKIRECWEILALTR